MGSVNQELSTQGRLPGTWVSFIHQTSRGMDPGVLEPPTQVLGSGHKSGWGWESLRDGS